MSLAPGNAPLPARVEQATSADIEEMLAIQAGCYTDDLRESHESFAAKLRSSPETCFVCRDRFGVAGYLITLPSRVDALPILNASGYVVPEPADSLYIHDLAVAKRCAGAGIGTKLFEAALAKGRAFGLTSSCLVAVQNSEGYWRRFGYEAVRELAPDLAIKLRSYGEGAVYMEMRL